MQKLTNVNTGQRDAMAEAVAAELVAQMKRALISEIQRQLAEEGVEGGYAEALAISRKVLGLMAQDAGPGDLTGTLQRLVSEAMRIRQYEVEAALA